MRYLTYICRPLSLYFWLVLQRTSISIVYLQTFFFSQVEGRGGQGFSRGKANVQGGGLALSQTIGPAPARGGGRAGAAGRGGSGIGRPEAPHWETTWAALVLG